MSPRNNSVPVRKSTFAVAQAHFAGPIPPAMEMEKYAQISPDLPEKIIQMAIKEQDHRFLMDSAEQKRRDDELKTNSTLIKWGIYASVICIIVIMLAAVLCAYFGHPITSGIIGGGGIVIIVSVFVRGSRIASNPK